MQLKKRFSILFSLLLLASSVVLQGQPCTDALTFFNAQEQIDSFPAKNPDCTSIEGTLYIDNGFGGDITNLDSLRQIITIKGGLNIFYVDGLQNLRGLEQLESVEGNLHIQLNMNLTTLSHLEQLKHVGHLEISENRMLKNLDGLQGLKKINGILEISRNDSLRSFIGLENLESIDGRFLINRNPLLENLVGLDKLKSVNTISIQENYALKNLEGLDSLRNIKTDLEIVANSSLSNLNGLGALDFVGNAFSVAANSSLIDLSGIRPVVFRGLEIFNILGNFNLENLDGIKYLGLDHVGLVRIVNNANLDLCATNSICDYLSLCKNLQIGNNLYRCSNLDDLETDCGNLPDYDFQWRCKVDLYPNPTTGLLNLRVYSQDEISTIDYEIRDMLGRLVRTGRHEGEQLDVSFLVAGSYFLTVRTDLQEEVFRFAKL